MMPHQTWMLRFGYKILKQTTGAQSGPLSHMTQYYLQSDSGHKLSFWNDIPIELVGDQVTNIVEIPKETHAKLQVVKQLEHHPFMQDTRANLFTRETELRFYAQFPLFNYGYIPQTWEQNIAKNEQGLYGDDDPVDVCELSESVKATGAIFQATVLGSFCLIDQGEVDWKILTMETEEATARKINCISDVNPQHLQSIKKWFKSIKVFDGKPENTIYNNEQILSKMATIEVIKSLHGSWQKLKTSDEPEYVRKRQNYHFP